MSGTGIKGNQIADGTVQGVDIDWDPHLTMKGHLIPDSNADYDLGNAEYKIRHLFLSDNSLWVGDNHKVDVGADGRKKSRMRKRSSPPKSIRLLRDAHMHGGAPLSAGDDAAKDAQITSELMAMFAGDPVPPSSLEDITLVRWLQYAQSLDGQANAAVDDIFNPEQYEDWEEVVEDGVAHHVVLKATNTEKYFELSITDNMDGTGTIVATEVS